MTSPPDLNRVLGALALPEPAAGARVVVAMSGGVDSSVVAALLSHAGYDVVGITLQLYDHGSAVHRAGACCAGDDIHDARRVAGALGIPHYVLDFEARFEDEVMNAFADSYLSGETPVPCVACNSRIKFADLLDRARELGAVALATGHYVVSRPSGDGWALYRGRDGERDQSYFLFATTAEQLAFLRFPLGHLHKREVRDLARHFALPVADKRDSQDICFVPTGRYTQVIERLRPGASEAGEIVHLDGRVIGRHDGIINYTIGQRRGIGVACGEPLYVVRLDAETNRVIVGPREALRVCRLELRDVNWLGDSPLAAIADADGLPVFARIRSTQAPVRAHLHLRRSTEAGAGPDAWRVIVTLDEAEDGVSPGQACVLYDGAGEGARVLGGGWIASTSSMGLKARRATPSGAGMRRPTSRPIMPTARIRAS